jgi:hypothetical protein
LEAKTREKESMESLYRPIETLFRDINDAPNSEFAERVGALLDLPLTVRTAAVQAYMAEWDGVFGAFGMNNFYLYRPAEGGRHRIVPWDEDNTFHALDYPVDADHERHVLMRSAMRVPALRQLFFDTLQQTALFTEGREAGQIGTWFEREVARRRDLVAARMREDRMKPFSEDDVAGAIAFNLEFARNRADIVREQIRQRQQQAAAPRR